MTVACCRNVDRFGPWQSLGTLMTTDEAPVQAAEPAELRYAAPTPGPALARRPGIWAAVLLICLDWAYVFVSERMELPTFTRFLSQMAALIVMGLGFFIWWLFS